MEPPPNGKWTAFFVDLQYENDETEFGKGLGWPFNSQHFEFTTAVSVVPNTYPYQDCYQETCQGKLV